jgi:hypothetical protein
MQFPIVLVNHTIYYIDRKVKCIKKLPCLFTKLLFRVNLHFVDPKNRYEIKVNCYNIISCARGPFSINLTWPEIEIESLLWQLTARGVSGAFCACGVREALWLLSKAGMRIIRPLSELTSAICQRRQIEHRSHTHTQASPCRHIWRPLIFQIALDSLSACYGVAAVSARRAQQCAPELLLNNKSPAG